MSKGQAKKQNKKRNSTQIVKIGVCIYSGLFSKKKFLTAMYNRSIIISTDINIIDIDISISRNQMASCTQCYFDTRHTSNLPGI